MREILDIRLPENWANEKLGSIGQRLSELTRRIVVEKDDPLFRTLSSLIGEHREQSGPLGMSATIRRVYTESEINAAELLYLIPEKIFEPCGEECGTKYDESTACPICGAGRKQISELILDLRKVPKSSDIACTIADEYVVSQQFAQLITQANLTGFELHLVRHKARYDDDSVDLRMVPSGRELLQLAKNFGIPHSTWQFDVWLNRPEQASLLERARNENVSLFREKALRQSKPMPTWYQLIGTSNPIQIISPPTLSGNDVFDEDREGRYRCPLGHILGLNILSEVWVSRGTWDGSDITQTNEMFGVRRGLLVPTPLLLISPRFFRLMRENNIRGYGVEIVHLV